MAQEVISANIPQDQSETGEKAELALLPPPPAAQQMPLDHNPAAIYLASLRPSGRRSMQHHLNTITDLARPNLLNKTDPLYKSRYLLMPWHELRYQHTSALRSLLQDHYKAPATTNTAIQALKRVLQEAWRLGMMEAEEYRRAADLQTIKSKKLLRGRQLQTKELTALVDICLKDSSPAGSRDAAMLAVLYGAGLRRSEVVKLRVGDYNRETGSLKILGAKGNKDRESYLGSQVEIGKWLALRETLGELSAGNTAPLFVSINKGGKLGKTAMTDQAVLSILRKRGMEAGLNSFSPHDLRRTFISDLLDAGADISTVQKLAGHADVSTTAKYDRRGEETKQKAAGLLRLKPSESVE